jgi:hypothetical protein
MRHCAPGGGGYIAAADPYPATSSLGKPDMRRRNFVLLACCVGLTLSAWPVIAAERAHLTEATLGTGATDKHVIIHPTTVFAPGTPMIYCAWKLRGVTSTTAVGAVWIAEDVGKAAPPNYRIGTTSKDMPADGTGIFTLSKPNNGFPVGKYRLDIFLNRSLVKTIRFTVQAK